MIAGELHTAYLKHPKTQEPVSDKVIGLFCESNSFANARDNCGLLEKLTLWKSDYSAKILSALEENSQIAGSWGVPERVEKLISEREPKPASSISYVVDDDIPF